MSRFNPKPISIDESTKIIETKLNWILSICNPSRVFIFGSAARKEMTDHSDVDLALIFPTEAELKEARQVVFLRPPEDEWRQDILLFTENAFEQKKHLGGVCQIIHEDGVCLFERSQK